MEALAAARRARRCSSSSWRPTPGMTTEEFEAVVATGSPPPATRPPAGPTPRWSTSPCSSCSTTCAPTASRPSSSPAAASSSCGRGPRRSTASRPSRSSARASRPSSRCATASRCSCACPRSTSSTTRRASRSASTRTSAAGRSPPSATPTATSRCCEWTTAGDGARLGVLVHHTDAEREWAYDRESHIGRLDRGLDEAADRGWVVVDMKRDWAAVYPAD